MVSHLGPCATAETHNIESDLCHRPDGTSPAASGRRRRPRGAGAGGSARQGPSTRASAAGERGPETVGFATAYRGMTPLKSLE